MDEKYYDAEGNPTSLEKLVKSEPEWACSVIRQLKSQTQELDMKLRKTEKELDKLMEKVLEYIQYS